MLSARAMLFVLLLSACAATAPLRPWTVTLTSSGGITGRGAGTFSASSEGGARCSATPEELQRIETLLARADAWRASYVPENSCCDRIAWTMTIDRAGRVQTVTWIDNPLPMPKEIEELARVLRGLRCGAARR